MATQKQMLAQVALDACKLGATVNVRKNSYGEYETRVRRNGKTVGGVYHAGSFVDGVETAKLVIRNLKAEEERQEREADKAYERELLQAISVIRGLLQTVNCTISRNDSGDVCLYSPKTGEHHLYMRRGVRPVSDLYAHGCGFAEMQTHRQ